MIALPSAPHTQEVNGLSITLGRNMVCSLCVGPDERTGLWNWLSFLFLWWCVCWSLVYSKVLEDGRRNKQNQKKRKRNEKRKKTRKARSLWCSFSASRFDAFSMITPFLTERKCCHFRVIAWKSVPQHSHALLLLLDQDIILGSKSARVRFTYITVCICRGLYVFYITSVDIRHFGCVVWLAILQVPSQRCCFCHLF